MSRRRDERSLAPIVDRLVEQRYSQALDAVAQLRSDAPSAGPDELADRLIRRYTRDLALGGAVAGGAAASPVAGVAVAAATAGADATYSIGRLSEMIMGLGLIYGHDSATVEERAGWVWAVLGMAEGATAGMTGLAARIGSRGGARLLARLPEASRGRLNAGMSRRVMAKVASGKGPWSLAALVPYGIGAGVGAAGNAVLTRSVGRAAKQFFAGSAPAAVPRVEHVGADEVEFEPAPDGGPAPAGGAEILDPEIVDAEIVDAEIVDAEIVD